MTSLRLTFEQAVPDDSERLSALCQRAKRSHGYDEAIIQLWLSEGDMHIARESIAQNTIMMAMVEGRLVGFAHLMPIERADTIYLEDLFIEPDVQGQGVGTALFEWAIAEARRRGFSWLEWDSDPNSAAFYLKVGGTQIAENESDLIPLRMIPKFRKSTGIDLPPPD